MKPKALQICTCCSKPMKSGSCTTPNCKPVEVKKAKQSATKRAKEELDKAGIDVDSVDGGEDGRVQLTEAKAAIKKKPAKKKATPKKKPVAKKKAPAKKKAAPKKKTK